MRVFVAGATGFIGRATCRSLVAAGHEVRGLARDPEKAARLESDGTQPVIGSLDEPESFLKAAGKPEAIVHLAATWFDGRETIEQALVIGERIKAWTIGLAQLGRASDLRLFVFCGSNANRAPDRRDDPRAGEAAGYQRLLGPAQTYLETEARDLPLAVVLPGWVYGPGSWFPVLEREVREGRTTHVVDGGEARLGYVHLDDVGEAFRLAVEKGTAGGFYNVVDEERLTARQFADATARALGVPSPQGVSRDQAIEERGDLYAEALTCSVDLDIERSQRELGWRLRYPTSREGLPAALRELGA
jgi:nucleoside-diphosphate-sugar epimerase